MSGKSIMQRLESWEQKIERLQRENRALRKQATDAVEQVEKLKREHLDVIWEMSSQHARRWAELQAEHDRRIIELLQANNVDVERRRVAERQVTDLTQRKDGAYEERNRCVALIARMALANGWQAGITRTAIEGWSEEWHGCVYIDLPSGQVSWHYHDSQAPLFAGLPPYEGEWDGHDTPEKYRRVDTVFDDL